MQLFYCPEINENNFALPEEEARHCLRVLRKTVGDKIDIIDGEGSLYSCTIVECTKRDCIVEINTSVREFGNHKYNLELAIAPTKNIDRIEWFLEKSTEIGINKVTFLNCSHSERKNIKIERLEKVVISAIKQSLKARKPRLTDITNFNEFISQKFDTEHLYIAHCIEHVEKAHLKNIKDYSKEQKVVILIGPEGDFSSEEVQLAIKNGFKPVTLGESRLRTETAAIYATSIISLL